MVIREFDCPRCSKRASTTKEVGGTFKCGECRETIIVPTDAIATEISEKESYFTEAAATIPTRTPAVSLLRFFAWLELIAGICIGFYFFANDSIMKEFRIWIGIVFTVQGILVWSLFTVIAEIAENVSANRKIG